MMGFFVTAKSRFKSWATAHPWLGLIIVYSVATTVDRTATNVFAWLFPNLSHVIGRTIGQLLPLFFVGSGLLTLAVGVFLVVLIVRARSGNPIARRSLATFGGKHFVVLLCILDSPESALWMPIWLTLRPIRCKALIVKAVTLRCTGRLIGDDRGPPLNATARKEFFTSLASF